MDNSLTFNDLKLLFFQKKWVIIISILVWSLLFGFYTFYTSIIDNQEGTTKIEETFEEPDYDIDYLLTLEEEELSEDESAYINEFLFEEAYSFRMYIENQDGTVFSRSNLFEELLLASDTLDYIEDQTQKNLDDYNEHFLKVELNSDNVVYTITLGLGDSNSSEAISLAYYEALQDNAIDIISSKNTKIFESPEPVDNPSEDVPEQPVNNEDNQNNWEEVVLSLIIGMIFGSGFGIFIVFIVSSMSKKINPIYNHRLSSEDIFINHSHAKMSDNEMFESLLHTISYPTYNRKLIVSQDKNLNDRLHASLKINTSAEFMVTNNVSEIHPRNEYDELIILCKNNLTRKSWYIKQKSQLRTYDKPLQVIKY